MTIEQLREKGIEVWVDYYRIPAGQDEILASRLIRHEGLGFEPRGGLTTVSLSLNGFPVAYGDAWCSPRDNFNKKIGRLIALGRAVKYARETGVLQ